ncbi:MAG TPA: isoprenylcysteine carboxylmethyltransferase family protein [Burkholderiaceae bacterium]|nr:isoprenylcysteine carboxylmethyltransferase family protein [Burkholderiaceae bacterium]
MNPLSAALVGAQFGLAALLLFTTRPSPAPLPLGLAAALLAASVAVGMAALAVNRPGNFNVRPEPKAGARLITHGIYRRIRHPMYTAFLLLTLAAVAADARAWRGAVWLALAAVLYAKARREERYLLQRHPGYAEYLRNTKRFLPGIA